MKKVGQANTFSVVFGSADGVQSSNKDKKQAATRHSAPCGKLKCQTRKNLCIAYTQVNTHAHFFLSLFLCFLFFSQWKSFTQKTHIFEGTASPSTRRWLKFISLTPDKPAPALSGTGSGVIKEFWRNSPLSRKKKKRRATHSNPSDARTRTQAHTHTKMHPWVHVDKFFNKLWLKGSWFYSDSPPSFQTVYWK